MSQDTEGKKRGMFSRLFGGGQSEPAPEAAPQPAPEQEAPEEEKRSWWSRLSGGLSRTSQ
ncbi:MAG: signal recognition particle-docking protein FtsY, partial [Methylocystis sp.]